jgi:photosystem II stability/assembly factor-like uncharacterized protein
MTTMDETLDREIDGQEHADHAVYALAASPAYRHDGMCFAATPEGLFRSTDHALTFAPAYDSLGLTEPLATAAVAVSPAFASDRTVFAGVHGAILRSLDGGATWQYALLRTPPPVVTCLAVSPNYEEDGIAFAGTLEDGVFRTADRGSRWASWNFGLIDLGVLCLAVSPAFGEDETLFAGTETGLFRSSNGGRAWREVGLPEDIAPVLSLALSSDYTQDGCLFAGTESNGLWKSSDHGVSWAPVEELGAEVVNALVSASGQRGPGLAALTDEFLRLSDDGGKTWRDLTLELPEDVMPVSLAAPEGLSPGATLLVGCSDGATRVALI